MEQVPPRLWNQIEQLDLNVTEALQELVSSHLEKTLSDVDEKDRGVLSKLPKENLLHYNHIPLRESKETKVSLEMLKNPDQFARLFQDYSELILPHKYRQYTLEYLCDQPEEFIRPVTEHLGWGTQDLTIDTLIDILWLFFVRPLPLVVNKETLEVLNRLTEKQLRTWCIATERDEVENHPTKGELLYAIYTGSHPYRLLEEEDLFPDSDTDGIPYPKVIRDLLYGWYSHDKHVRSLSFGYGISYLSQEGESEFPFSRYHFDPFPGEIRKELREALPFIPPGVDMIIAEYAAGDNIGRLAQRMGVSIPGDLVDGPSRTEYFWKNYNKTPLIPVPHVVAPTGEPFPPTILTAIAHQTIPEAAILEGPGMARGLIVRPDGERIILLGRDDGSGSILLLEADKVLARSLNLVVQEE